MPGQMQESGPIRVFVHTAIDGYAWQGVPPALAQSLQACLDAAGTFPGASPGRARQAAGGAIRCSLSGVRGTAVYRYHRRIAGDFRGRDSHYVALAFFPADFRFDLRKVWSAPAMRAPADGAFESLSLSPDDWRPGPGLSAGGVSAGRPVLESVVVPVSGPDAPERIAAAFQGETYGAGALNCPIFVSSGGDMDGELVYEVFPEIPAAAAAREEFFKIPAFSLAERREKLETWRAAVSALEAKASRLSSFPVLKRLSSNAREAVDAAARTVATFPPRSFPGAAPGRPPAGVVFAPRPVPPPQPARTYGFGPVPAERGPERRRRPSSVVPVVLAVAVAAVFAAALALFLLLPSKDAWTRPKPLADGLDDPVKRMPLAGQNRDLASAGTETNEGVIAEPKTEAVPEQRARAEEEKRIESGKSAGEETELRIAAEKAAAERKAFEEAERKSRDEAERMFREESELEARDEEERKAREAEEKKLAAESKAREEEERKVREAEEKRLAAESKARKEEERKAREAEEKRLAAESKAREEEERKAREEAEEKRLAAERKARAEAELKAAESRKVAVESANRGSRPSPKLVPPKHISSPDIRELRGIAEESVKVLGALAPPEFDKKTLENESAKVQNLRRDGVDADYSKSWLFYSGVTNECLPIKAKLESARKSKIGIREKDADEALAGNDYRIAVDCLDSVEAVVSGKGPGDRQAALKWLDDAEARFKKTQSLIASKAEERRRAEEREQMEKENLKRIKEQKRKAEREFDERRKGVGEELETLVESVYDQCLKAGLSKKESRKIRDAFKARDPFKNVGDWLTYAEQGGGRDGQGRTRTPEECLELAERWLRGRGGANDEVHKHLNDAIAAAKAAASAKQSSGDED